MINLCSSESLKKTFEKQHFLLSVFDRDGNIYKEVSYCVSQALNLAYFRMTHLWTQASKLSCSPLPKTLFLHTCCIILGLQNNFHIRLNFLNLFFIHFSSFFAIFSVSQLQAVLLPFFHSVHSYLSYSNSSYSLFFSCLSFCELSFFSFFFCQIFSLSLRIIPLYSLSVVLSCLPLASCPGF